MSKRPFYDDDLAYIHDVGFSSFAQGSAPGILKLLARAGIHCGLVVDVGCGGGVVAKHLVDAGYQIYGLDFSSAMIALARRRIPAAELHVGSVWNVKLPRCRALTALGEVLCYLGNRNGSKRDLGALFGKFYDSLETGGLLLFDVAEIGLDRDRARTFAQGKDWACMVGFDYDGKRDLLTRQITTFRKVGDMYRRSQEQHVVQLYDGNEVARKLRDTGFRVRRIRHLGSFPLLPQRVGFVARKP